MIRALLVCLMCSCSTRVQNSSVRDAQSAVTNTYPVEIMDIEKHCHQSFGAFNQCAFPEYILRPLSPYNENESVAVRTLPQSASLNYSFHCPGAHVSANLKSDQRPDEIMNFALGDNQSLTFSSGALSTMRISIHVNAAEWLTKDCRLTLLSATVMADTGAIKMSVDNLVNRLALLTTVLEAIGGTVNDALLRMAVTSAISVLKDELSFLNDQVSALEGREELSGEEQILLADLHLRKNNVEVTLKRLENEPLRSQGALQEQIQAQIADTRGSLESLRDFIVRESSLLGGIVGGLSEQLKVILQEIEQSLSIPNPG